MLPGRGAEQKKRQRLFREKNGEPSASSFSSGTEKTYQPKEQMKNRTGAQTGRTAGRQATGGRETERKERRSGTSKADGQDV